MSYLSLKLGLLAPEQLAVHPNLIWGHLDPRAQFLHSEKCKFLVSLLLSFGNLFEFIFFTLSIWIFEYMSCCLI